MSDAIPDVVQYTEGYQQWGDEPTALMLRWTALRRRLQGITR